MDTASGWVWFTRLASGLPCRTSSNWIVRVVWGRNIADKPARGLSATVSSPTLTLGLPTASSITAMPPGDMPATVDRVHQATQRPGRPENSALISLSPLGISFFLVLYSCWAQYTGAFNSGVAEEFPTSVKTLGSFCIFLLLINPLPPHTKEASLLRYSVVHN